MALDRQQMIDLLSRLGYAQAADEAARALPDPVSVEQVREFAARHNISHDELISRMGGSP
ncbi:MAG TPA: hypothetical protein VGG83_14705 [Trebonia sp.]|jgi:hypothetical protein